MKDRILTIEEIKQLCRDVFPKYRFIQKIYLFGSYARGQAGIGSDIDLFAEVDYSMNIGVLFYAPAVDIEEKCGKSVDLLTVNEIRDAMPSVLTKGVLVYEQ